MIFLIPTNPPPRLEGSQFSDAMKDFVAQCLQKDPVCRPTARVLLDHVLFQGVSSSSSSSAAAPASWREIVDDVVAVNNAKVRENAMNECCYHHRRKFVA